MAGTAYRILQRHEAGVWTESSKPIEAASAEAAIRKYVEAANDQAQTVTDQATVSGTFVAIPERSFSPVTVETEVTHRVKLVGAGHAAPAHPPAPKADTAA